MLLPYIISITFIIIRLAIVPSENMDTKDLREQWEIVQKTVAAANESRSERQLNNVRTKILRVAPK